MARDYKPDAFKLQELVAKGIPMKPREPEPPIEPMEVSHEVVSERSKSVERTKKRVVSKGDYESLFVVKNDLKERKTIYIAKELLGKLTDVIMSMKNREMTIGIYVENIVLHHFEMYKDEINSISETKFKKPL